MHDLKETTTRLREMLAKAEEARALYGRNNLATFDLEFENAKWEVQR